MNSRLLCLILIILLYLIQRKIVHNVLSDDKMVQKFIK